MRLQSTTGNRLRLIGEEGRGIIIYELQEGRGIGLMNKLRAYELQDRGAIPWKPTSSSVSRATSQLCVCPARFRHLGIGAVRLLSNNPAK